MTTTILFSALPKEGCLLFFEKYRSTKYSMFKLSDDNKKREYFGEAHSGKNLGLSNSTPNGSGGYVIGALTLPVVVSLADGQEITFDGETLPHPSKWPKVCEEEDDEESPIFDSSLFSGGGMIDIKSPDFDFTALVTARKIDESSPAKKSRHE